MPERDQKTPVGADLIIPVAAAAYGVYYVASVTDFPFEAQISGIVLAGVLGILVLFYFFRVARGLRSGELSLGVGQFFGPADSLPARAAFIGLIVGFIVVLPYLGSP